MKAKHRKRVFSRAEIALSVAIDRAISGAAKGKSEVITVDDRGIVILTHDIKEEWSVIGNTNNKQ